MPSHGQIARSVRESKERHPERYCRHHNCLWQVVTRTKVNPCPRHPAYNTHLEDPAKRRELLASYDSE